MARLYTAGVVKLGEEVAEYLGISYGRLQDLMWDDVVEVLSGTLTLDDALEKATLVHSARQDFIGALEEFDYGINLNPSLGYPDHEDVHDSPETVEAEYSIVGLARKAWEKIVEGDYIPGIFSLSVLSGIFLSSYSYSDVGMVDYSSLLPVFEPLKTSIAALALEDDYEEHRRRTSRFGHI